MASNLLETVRAYLTPDLIDSAGTHVGESSSGINKAVTASIPALLAMFVNRAEKGDAQGLYNDANEAANSNVLQDRQKLFSGGIGSILPGEREGFRGLSGQNSSSLTSIIANYAGIKTDSVQKLLAMLAPLSLAALGKHTQENNITASGFATYMSGQKNAIRNAIPQGFPVDDLFGDRVEPTASTAPYAATTETTERFNEPERKKTNWVPLLLLGLGLVALIWFLTRDRDETTSSISSADSTSIADTSNTSTVPVADMSTRESTKVKLNDGTEINAYKGGVEDQLVACLNDAGCEAGKDQWYDFDNINFEVGSAKLTAESQAQVNNIAAILKAYPDAKIKIGGYTDKTGDDAANQTLSQQRAEAVLNAIKEAGADNKQLAGAEGYGSKFAKASATATDDERRQDRRIAVQLRDK